jgi:hypothetical protein
MIERITPVLVLTLAGTALAQSAEGQPKVMFNRDIRPILTENCYHCHGPDQNHRKADLRLDMREEAVKQKALIPGNAEASEVIKRIVTSDGDDLMPPADSHKKLTDAEKDLLKRWVAEGAEYQGHWAFEKPVKPELPSANIQGFPVQNGIDRFIHQALQKRGWSPSSETDRVTLLRRVTLDLTGLPPSQKEVDDFIKDTSPEAYERAVDRLFKSPSYGEQMAMQWLDYARYADSHGFQTDSSRSMWPWRDWVIQAFNANLPFDQFTIEQLAGDLLPNPQRSQVVATGFHRNHRINGEGGIIDEEWRIENIIDRVDTTGATWMGLTLGCARCHDHKYDPISQKEFYELFAFFNNVAETGVIRGASNRSGGNPDPIIKVPSETQEKELAQMAATVKEAESAVATALRSLPADMAAWEPGFEASLNESKSVWEPLTPIKVVSNGGTTLSRLEDGSYLAGGKVPVKETYVIDSNLTSSIFSGLLLEVLPDPSLPAQSVGRYSNGNFVLSGVEAEIRAPSLKESVMVQFTAAEADYSQKGYGVESLISAKSANPSRRKKEAKSNRGPGWAVDGPSRKEPSRAMLLTSSPVSVPPGAQISIRLKHEAIGGHSIGRFRLSFTSSNPESVTLDGEGGAPEKIRKILALEIAKRSPAQVKDLTAFFRAGFDSPIKRADSALAAAKAKYDAFEATVPSSMVMKELPDSRPAHILLRGQYENKGPEVKAATPAVLPALPEGAPRNRLTLARWLVSREHPLTARVWVNRLWERFFGKGLVKSSENLGVQSDPPSHPELLDWLATEFTDSGWDMKALQKLIVMSATYRQSSNFKHLSPEVQTQDPENRYLARGPRLRLSAESIRDQALAVSGLLDSQIGGPSVRPYMPEGVWDETSRYGDLRGYKHDPKNGLYRRTLYTIWKRTAAPPTMLLFDSPSREICTVKRSRTNTPLQALALLNEVTYVETARVLAQRMMSEGGRTPAERIGWAFRQVTNRQATANELSILSSGHARYLKRYQTAPEEAQKLSHIGEAPRTEANPAELAAYTVTANVILNLDEIITKE